MEPLIACLIALEDGGSEVLDEALAEYFGHDPAFVRALMEAQRRRAAQTDGGRDSAKELLMSFSGAAAYLGIERDQVAELYRWDLVPWQCDPHTGIPRFSARELDAFLPLVPFAVRAAEQLRLKAGHEYG